jgi:hypothetical protein
VALFAAEARRRGHPAGHATAAAGLVYLADMAAFVCVLALGMVVLIRRGGLTAGEVTASLLLVLIAAISDSSLSWLCIRAEARKRSWMGGDGREPPRATHHPQGFPEPKAGA